jgi:hypothetical protein
MCTRSGYSAALWLPASAADESSKQPASPLSPRMKAQRIRDTPTRIFLRISQPS